MADARHHGLSKYNPNVVAAAHARRYRYENCPARTIGDGPSSTALHRHGSGGGGLWRRLHCETAAVTQVTAQVETTEAPATTQVATVATTPATTTTTEAPPEPVDVSFRLDFFTFNGYHNAAHVADEMGWFADEGITIDIREGQGSTATAQAVAAGETDFGMVVGTTIIDSVFQGLEIKSVAQHLVFSGFCVITVPSVSGITSVG